MIDHKPFRLIVNRNNKEVFYSVGDKPFERDDSKSAYNHAAQLTMVLRTVPEPAKVLLEMADVIIEKKRDGEDTKE